MPLEFPIGSHPQLFLKIGEGEDIGNLFTKFEWKSFMNGGYIIKGKIEDVYWRKIKNIATDFYLKEGRKKPTRVEFGLSWPGVKGENSDTGHHLAYMTGLDARGIEMSGSLEFIAVDPPSYWLNAGDSSGKVYKGKVSQVIKRVVEEYFPDGDVEVSDTNDFEGNQWWMMRMDPKTFIASLIEWSSRTTNGRTNWIVSSGGAIENGSPIIWIKEQADRKSVNYGEFSMNIKAGNTIYSIHLLADNLTAVLSKQLITHGISTVSERYFDRKSTSPPHTGKDSNCVVHVHDENTSNKKTSFPKGEKYNPIKGFLKPGGSEDPNEWSTSIPSVPEIYSAQDIGMAYDEYIDGTARQMFLNMLNLVMRIKIHCTGIATKDLANSHYLGVSKLKILWKAGNEDYFLDGPWLVYGFHHIVTRRHWWTDIYCYRTDIDASAIPV